MSAGIPEGGELHQWQREIPFSWVQHPQKGLSVLPPNALLLFVSQTGISSNRAEFEWGSISCACKECVWAPCGLGKRGKLSDLGNTESIQAIKPCFQWYLLGTGPLRKSDPKALFALPARWGFSEDAPMRAFTPHFSNWDEKRNLYENLGLPSACNYNFFFHLLSTSSLCHYSLEC